MVWEGDEVITSARSMIGSKLALDSLPGTIRGDLCIDSGNNLIHSSDSPDSAKKEIHLWFKESEVVSWSHHSQDQIYEMTD